MKEKGGAGCEASVSFMAWDVTEKYQSKMHWPLEQLEISVACNASDKCFFTDSSRQVTQPCQANILTTFLKYLQSLQLSELNCNYGLQTNIS